MRLRKAEHLTDKHVLEYVKVMLVTSAEGQKEQDPPSLLVEDRCKGCHAPDVGGRLTSTEHGSTWARSEGLL